MAGVGRRTLYRKSVTDDYLNSTPEPGDNEEIALVQAPRGSNIIEVNFLFYVFIYYILHCICLPTELSDMVAPIHFLGRAVKLHNYCSRQSRCSSDVCMLTPHKSTTVSQEYGSMLWCQKSIAQTTHERTAPGVCRSRHSPICYLVPFFAPENDGVSGLFPGGAFAVIYHHRLPLSHRCVTHERTTVSSQQRPPDFVF